MNMSDMLSKDVIDCISKIEETLPPQYDGNPSDEEVIKFLQSLTDEQVNCLFKLLAGFQLTGQQMQATKMQIQQQHVGR